MDIKANTLIYIIAASFILIMLAYTFLGPLLNTLYQLLFKREKHHNVDLDVLIKKQKMLMGSNQKQKKSDEISSNNEVSKTLKKYTDHFKENPNDKHIKQILAIFDEIQWGDGSFVKEQTKFLKSRYKIDQSTSSLSKQLNYLVQKDFFISLHSTELASIEQIKNALRVKSFFEVLVHQCHLRRGDTIEYLAKKYHMQPLSIILAFELIVMKMCGKSQEQSYKAVTSKTAKETSLLPNDMSKVFKKIIFKENRKDFSNCEELSEEIAVEAKAIEFILPLPRISNEKDLEAALKIFKATHKTTIDEIKKRYKKMAINKHPDKLNSYGIPKQYEKLASENFSRLKSAYDIILKSKEDKK